MVTVRARITLQWLRDGSPTAGAGVTTYALLAADSDTTHTVEVAPVTTGGATAGCATTSSGVADASIWRPKILTPRLTILKWDLEAQNLKPPVLGPKKAPKFFFRPLRGR